MEPVGGKSTRVALFIALTCAVPSIARAQTKKPAPASAASAPAPAASTPPATPAPADVEVRLSDEAELQRVVGLYEAGKYEECAHELDRLLNPDGKRPISRSEVRETARIYHAACLIGSGQFERADKPLEDAINENPSMGAPDSLIFPKPVVQRFLLVQQRKREKIQKEEQDRFKEAQRQAALQKARERAEALRVRQLEELAGREVIVTQNRRWIAAVPFGAGQFQNGDRGLGWVFLGSEVLTLGAALTSLAVATQIDAQAAEFQNEGKETDAEDRKKAWHLAGTISSWAFISLAAIGITEAQVSFVPEKREIRRRALPPPPQVPSPSGKLEVSPSVAAGPDGMLLGVHGRF